MKSSSSSSSKKVEAVPPGDDDEPDYMSDAFLLQCTQNDLRPSLLHRREDKRKHELAKRNREKNKTKEELEEERVTEMTQALNKPISVENKGFQLLQKMGYKPGSSLGKNTSEQQGLKEPIKIDLKRGRGGLGQDDVRKKPKYNENLPLANTDEFRSRRQALLKIREVENDVRMAQSACHNLDEKAGLLDPPEPWFWPEMKLASVEDVAPQDSDLCEERDSLQPLKHEAEDEDFDLDEGDPQTGHVDSVEISAEVKLEKIVSYLRSKYNYCLWCGTRFENFGDMDSNCPGSKDDH